MNNDLISREALKKVWQEECGGECAICGYLITEKGKDGCNEWVGCALIDNAPTVEPSFGLFRSMFCETCQAYATNRAIAKLADEYTRPHGEWLEPFESNGKTYHKCTHCHISSELFLIDNFCPNCGADMRGEA